jgi:hypothetical protein
MTITIQGIDQVTENLIRLRDSMAPAAAAALRDQRTEIP